MKLSLVDLVKIVLACAVAVAFITPTHRMVERTGYMSWKILFYDGLALPLVLSLFAFAFVRDASRRAATVEALLLGSVASALGYLLHEAASTLLLPRVRGWGLVSMRGEGLPVIAAMLLAGLAGWLGLRLARRARRSLARRQSPG